MKADWCNIRVSVPWRSNRHFRDLRIWLLDNINDLDYDFMGVEFGDLDNRIYYFARQDDAVMFTLRWS